MVMGSKKIEVVVDAIHLFIKEMNQVIDNARSMRNELQKYRELLSDKIGPEFMEGDYKEFGDEDEDQNASSSANALLQTRKKRSHREGSLGIPIPPSVSEELAETHSAFERSTYLKEQFNETSGSLSNSKEIAAALFPVGSQSFSDTSAEEKADLVAETALKTGKSLTPTPKIALTEDWNTKKKPNVIRLKSLRKIASRKRIVAPLATVKLQTEKGQAKKSCNSSSSSLLSLGASDDAFRKSGSPSLQILSEMKRFAAKSIENRNISKPLKISKISDMKEDSVLSTKKQTAMSEIEASGIIGRNAKAYQARTQESMRNGVAHLISDLPEVTHLPNIKSFGRNIQDQDGLLDDYHDTERIIREQSIANEMITKPPKQKIVISCESNLVWLWDVLIFVISIYVAITVPIQLSLIMYEENTEKPSTFFKVVSPIVDSLYVMDIALKMRTSFLNYVKEEIVDIKQIQRRYLCSTTFKVDLCAAFPWASLVTWVTLFQTTPLGVLAFFRIIKIIGESYWNKIKVSLSKSTHQNPAILRMIGIILLFCLVAHHLACAYAYNRFHNNFNGNWSLNEEDLFDEAGKSSATRYFEAMFFSLAVIAANDQAPSTLGELQFGVLGMLISFIVNAAIIGIATNVLSQMDTTAIAQKEQIDAVSDYLRYRRVPLKLYSKILSYYSYLWEIGQSSHSETLFKELPDKLKLELIVTLNKKLIESVPLFTTFSPAGVIMVVKRLRPSIVLPFELIIKEGERADSMFFLNRGTVRCYIFNENGEKIYLATLRDGSFFGEVAMMEGNLERTANVKAFSFCELQILMSNDFKAVLKAFPDFNLAVGKVAKARQLLSRRMSSMKDEDVQNGNDSHRFKLRNVVNAKMFIKERFAHPPIEEEENSSKITDNNRNDFYEAILENQRKMTRMAAEEAMQRKDNINEQDFIKFERAVNSKYENQVRHLHARRQDAVRQSASAFADLHQMVAKKNQTS